MMEIHVPAKIILFGEWAVLEGGTCVGVPLRAQFKLTAEPAAETRLSTDNLDLDTSGDLLQTDKWARAVWERLQHALPLTKNFSMRSTRDWPLHEGLGSSSALFLSLLEMHERALDVKLTWPQVLEIFRSIEGNRGSGMDLAIQRARTAIVYRHFNPTPLENFVWPANLTLLHGKRKAESATEITKVKCTPEQSERINRSAEDFLASDFSDDAWLAAMRSHGEVLSEMAVTPPEGRDLFENLTQRAGLEAYKSVGAGGMDGLLVWTREPGALKKFQRELQTFGWYLSPHGSLA